MKKYKKKTLKIIKWGAIVIIGYWFISTLILGHTNLNTKTGVKSFGWSGLDALFSNEKFGFFINEPLHTNLSGVDGPHIINETKYWVNEESQLKKEKLSINKPVKVYVDNSDKDSFDVKIRNSHYQESVIYDKPSKIIAISDIEGNFNALHSFLINNKVIDENYNWIFGNGHLVLNGDFFDRGKNVTQVLWLIYSLEEKAKKEGGKVHFINGNHEIMNLYGNVSYSIYKYVEVAKQISNKKYWDEASKYLYSENSELGKWLRTKNVIEKIGNYIFVHGGLNTKIIESDLNISEINKIAKDYYGKRLRQNHNNPREKLIVQSHSSPYWDRSLANDLLKKTVFFFNGSKLEKTTESDLERILDFYNAEKIVIGHSVVSEVSTDYNGKVIKIDVKHDDEKNSAKTQGLLIENEMEYRVDGLGNKVEI